MEGDALLASSPRPHYIAQIFSYSRGADVTTSLLRAILRVFLLLVPVFLASCGSGGEAPFDRSDSGFLALRWGMSPDSARSVMLQMPDVSFGLDTTYVAPRSRYPAFRDGDSVEYSDPPVEEQHYHYLTFGGGTFRGNPVKSWSLVFREARGLSTIYINVEHGERDQREFMLISQDFGERYREMDPDPWGFDDRTRGYQSIGISGWGDTTLAPDTRIRLTNNQQGDGLSISYTSIRHNQADVEANRTHRRVMATRKQWEAMVKREGFE